MKTRLLALAAVLLALPASLDAAPWASSPARVTDVAPASSHTCAVTEAGSAKCWGANLDWKLGDGTQDSHLTPVDVAGLTGGMAMVATGTFHSCGLTAKGGVKCWGFNSHGMLGDGTQQPRATPVDVVGLSGVQAITAGFSHTCALTAEGGAKCWGGNPYGQLGADFHDLRNGLALTPVEVAGLTSGVKAITAGHFHTCAVTTAGAVKCWGFNVFGQLGNGRAWGNETLPVDVVGLSQGVRAVAVGFEHTCALLESGGVQCWGRNFYGELGDGTTTLSAAPVDVVGLASGVQAVAVAQYHSCALLEDGSVRCWGDNFYGQLGDGTKVDRLTPVAVQGLSGGVVALALGDSHSCVILDSGGLQCWGSNHFGQLGDGTRQAHATPAYVVGLEGDLPTPTPTPTSTPAPNRHYLPLALR